MDRAIVIGDIHGCYVELVDMLDEVGIGPEDRVISVGDLITKGPGNREVVEFVRRRQNFTAVLGNHEYTLLQHYRGEDVSLMTEHFQAISDLGETFEECMEWVASWPLYLDLGDYFVVHAGIRPDRPLKEQAIQDLTQLRTLEGPDPGSRTGTPWF